jgi:mannose-6-phosphate isomerase-like protein (cupin superfamily)
VKTKYSEVASYLTKDGCEIRELMHPEKHGNCNQSIAEATIRPGQKTALHCHRWTEEIYHFIQGSGIMTLADECLEVTAGDTVCIAPGTPHCVENTGRGPLRILCACSPPYSHDDTLLI